MNSATDRRTKTSFGVSLSSTAPNARHAVDRATTYTVRDDGKRLIAIYFYEPGVNCWYNSYDMKYRKSRDETVAAIIHGFAHSGQDRPHGCAECLFYETGDRYCTEAMRRSGPTMPMCIRFVHGPMHAPGQGA